MKIQLSGLLILLLMSFISNGQDVKIENLQATQGGRLSFEYTIAQSHSPRERYDVKIYTSADEFKNPLNIPQKNIPPGLRQTVTFLGSEHLPSGYAGSLRIRVVAEATLYPVQITNYSKKAKLGSSVQIQWKDAANKGRYDVVVDQNGQSTTLASGVTGLSFSGALPGSLSKGSYDLKVFPSGDQLSASDEVPFAVVAKIGMGMKILGVVAAGGVGILASGGGGGGGGTTDTSLPGPPDTPGN